MRNVVVCLVGACGLAAAAGAQPILPVADLTSGATVGSSIFAQGVNGGAQRAFWDFWTFSANAGDVIGIHVRRIDQGLDPMASVVFGNVTGLDRTTEITDDGGAFNWTGPGLSPVIASGDDDIDQPGPFGDPDFGFVAPATGVYSFIVAGFLSTEPFPENGYAYTARVTGSTVPNPGAAAMLGLAGVVATRRRRR